MNEMPGLEKQKSQSGQALVEYVLLLAIGATLLLGLASQFYKPFGNWVQNQMGPYLECLLDVGELPTLGNTDADGECASQFRPFTPGANANVGTPGAGGRNGENSSGGNNSRNRKPGSSDKDGSTSGPTASGGDSSSSRMKGFPTGGTRGADGPGSSQGDQVVVEKLPESKYMKLRSSGSASVVYQQRIQSVGIAGVLSQEQVKRQNRENPTVKVATLEESEITSKNRTITVKAPERKTAAEEPELPWSFGEYFKFAIILMIIVAIILFIAGQVAQISKSMEK